MKKVIVFSIAMFFVSSVFAFGGGGTGVKKITAGTNITITPTGGTGAVTINSTGGGGTLPTATTFFFTVGSGGDVYRCDSNGFVGSPNAVFITSHSYIITDYQPYNLYASTSTPQDSIDYSSYRIAWTSSTMFNTEFSYITTNTTVPVNNKYGVWTSTYIVIGSGDAIAVHVTTCPVTSGGVFPGEWGMKIKALWYWVW